MDWYCPNCGGEGEIKHRSSEKPIAVICKKCSFIDAYVWCETCGEGGQIADVDFNARPREWKCRGCRKSYILPPNFYERLVEFEPQAFSPAAFSIAPPSKRYFHIPNVHLRRLVVFWDQWRTHVVISGIILFILLLAIIFLEERIGKFHERSGFVRFLLQAWSVLSLGWMPAVLVFDSFTSLIVKFHNWRFRRANRSTDASS